MLRHEKTALTNPDRDLTGRKQGGLLMSVLIVLQVYNPFKTRTCRAGQLPNHTVPRQATPCWVIMYECINGKWKVEGSVTISHTEPILYFICDVF